MAVAPPRVLIIAGTDPLCGAGAVADALAAARLGAQPLVVESALVEQDSHGVRGLFVVPLDTFTRQLACALADGTPHVAKIGLLPTAAHVRVVSAALVASGVPAVLDPVLCSSAGRPLVDDLETVRDAVVAALRPGVLLTPNARELGVLCRAATPATLTGAAELAQVLADATGAAVLAKGGHLEPRGADLLVADGVLRRFSPLRWAVDDIHGTGCHLATAIAAGLAQGRSVAEAVGAARRALARWSRDAVAIGGGRPQFVHARRR